MCRREAKYGRRVVSRSFKAYVKRAPLRFTRIQNSSTTRATSHTDREGRKLSLETPLDRSFPLTSLPLPLSLYSPRTGILPSPPLSLTVPSSSLSFARSLALFASSSSFPSSLAPHTRALSRPSSGYHRFRVCTWARRSIFQAVAHEKRSSWGRVPHCHGRRR